MHGVSCIFISERKDRDPWKAHKLTKRKHKAYWNGWWLARWTRNATSTGPRCFLPDAGARPTPIFLLFALCSGGVPCIASHRPDNND